ncbi:hypothetical protein ACFL0W_05425 [Nanoarchaeota archaeon]
MPKCPHCKEEINFDNIKTIKKGAGLFKQEIIYFCPACESVIGISRGKWSG